MTRPTKKRRADEQEEETTITSSSLSSGPQTKALLATLTDTLDTLESSDPTQTPALLKDASGHFLKLKSLQRRVLDKLRDTQNLLEAQRQRRDEQELTLENLQYQTILNEHSIQMCQTRETTQLVKLCCDETDQTPPSEEVAEAKAEDAEESSSANNKTESEHEMLQTFFGGADVKDPAQRTIIVAKLNLQVSTRMKLEKTLKHSQHKAASLKQSLAAKRKLLQELPLKLYEMERASLPLQKFCQKSRKLASTKLGTKRRTNLDLAQSLPKALYTLYYQLLSCLDTMAEAAADSEKETLPTVQVGKDSSSVVMKLPVPLVDSASLTTTFKSTKKVATISFEYSKKMDMVTAHCSSEHEMGTNLIGELFPGDRGEYTGEEGATTANNVNKRPYNWCNYLAGLHLTPKAQSAAKMHLSTRVVVKALIRRARALSTLHWLVHSLARKPNPIPVHPAMQDVLMSSEPVSSAKLSSWKEQNITAEDDDSEGDDAVNYCKDFVATLKRKSVSLTARARIHVARYPAVPPKWELSCNTNTATSQKDTNGPTSSLYDDRLAALERRVNATAIEELVNPTNESTYDWILSHQLAEIAKGWDEIRSNGSFLI